MNSQEKWNYIVKSYKQDYSKPESEVQRSWEDIFSEFFDYKKLCGELVTQTYIQLGSRNALIPDIVLKKDGETLVDIELKQYGLSFDLRFENQLISYLKQLNLSIGGIICNKIYLYVFSYPNLIDKIEIPFEEGNERGVAFVELLNKNNFDVDKIKAFVSIEREKEEKQRDRIVVENEIKRKITPDYVKECVYEYLLLMDYPKDIVENVLKDYVFKVETKDALRTYYDKRDDRVPGPVPRTPLPIKDFVIKNSISSIGIETGYDFYDLKGNKMGVVFATHDKKGAAFGKCEMCFYSQYEETFRRYHRFKINGERMDFAVLKAYLETHDEKRITID